MHLESTATWCSFDFSRLRSTAFCSDTVDECLSASPFLFGSFDTYTPTLSSCFVTSSDLPIAPNFHPFPINTISNTAINTIIQKPWQDSAPPSFVLPYGNVSYVLGL